MYVAGTAGHVDHGKSTLIQALTGIDPDRLEQEKSRGMTIELGFAWMEMQDGNEISIVDVPGHERFVKTMLMGAGGFDLALLVVAADEGVMPQTREHLAILDLLNVEHGIVVITKVDAADAELVELVELEVAEEIVGTSLEDSPFVAVSAETGDGLDKLKDTIFYSLKSVPPRTELARPRLFIDRSFSVQGFGAVVTGTLGGGTLKLGDEVEILPSKNPARIRGLQSHKSAVETAHPGSRVAVSLSGISHSDIQRGDALCKRGQFSLTTIFDASLRGIESSPRSIKHNHHVTIYSGTWEEPATLRLLSGNRLAPGGSGYAQIKLAGARPVSPGDRFVVRDSNDTLGGGVALVMQPGRHRRNDPILLEHLRVLAEGSQAEVAAYWLEANPFITSRDLATLSNLGQTNIDCTLATLTESGEVLKFGPESRSARYVSSKHWDGLKARARRELVEYHRRYPLRVGMPLQELRNRLVIDSGVYDAVLELMEEQSDVTVSATTVKLPEHRVTFSSQQKIEADRYLNVLREHRYSPPAWNTIEGELLTALAQRREVVLAGPDVVFIAEAYDEMRSRVIDLATIQGEISINDVRELLGTSRKYSLALLEQLDRENVTMRNGDLRTLR